MTSAILYEASVSRGEVGVVAAGVEVAFASGHTIVDNGAQNEADP